MASQAIKKELVVSSAPHFHTGARISKAMYTFMIALLPAVVMSISVFGMHAVRMITLAVASAMISELAIQKLSQLSRDWPDQQYRSQIQILSEKIRSGGSE